VLRRSMNDCYPSGLLALDKRGHQPVMSGIISLHQRNPITTVGGCENKISDRKWPKDRIVLLDLDAKMWRNRI
jgi:hypothetical protein